MSQVLLIVAVVFSLFVCYSLVINAYYKSDAYVEELKQEIIDDCKKIGGDLFYDQYNSPSCAWGGTKQ